MLLRFVLVAVVLFVGTPIVGTQETPPPPPPLRVHFIDVGQGDAVLIQSPTGQNVLYDAGEHPTKVRDYLIGLGLSAVGLVIASHNHADHIGGLAEVVRHFRPQYYMDNAVPTTTLTYARVLDAVSGSGSQLLEPTARQIALGDASLAIVPPPGIPDWDQNDNSIGLMVQYGEFRMSLTGDAEPREWAWWFTHQRDRIRNVRVHKASHHGSSNGDTRDALAQLAPTAVIIGVGTDNSYGHPNPDALRLYAEAGANVYRTDLNGTVMVEAHPTGAYTVRVERGEGAQPPPPPTPAPPPGPSPTPTPAPTPTPTPTPTGPPSSWTDPLPPRSSGSHPVCQIVLPTIAACVNNLTGPPQAICNDRAFSCSTGSGTCSGHGGVYCWRN